MAAFNQRDIDGIMSFFTEDSIYHNLPIVGVFEIRGGKISAWRDYFDLATWQRQTKS